MATKAVLRGDFARISTFRYWDAFAEVPLVLPSPPILIQHSLSRVCGYLGSTIIIIIS